MPESADKSRSRKKKDQQLPEQEQPYEPTGSVVGSGIPDASEPKQNGEIDLSTGESENSEEFPSWLFELESKAVTVPSETAITENSLKYMASSQVSKSTDTSDEVMHEDLPD